MTIERGAFFWEVWMGSLCRLLVVDSCFTGILLLNFMLPENLSIQSLKMLYSLMVLLWGWSLHVVSTVLL